MDNLEAIEGKLDALTTAIKHLIDAVELLREPKSEPQRPKLDFSDIPGHVYHGHFTEDGRLEKRISELG